MTDRGADPEPCRDRAFEALFRNHRDFVTRVLRSLGVTEAQLDDAVQDVFVVAYRRRNDFAGGNRVAWLRAICRHTANNYRRSARRAARKRLELQQTARSSTAPAEALSQVRDLNAFMASLSDPERELLAMSELEGRSGPELAHHYGLNANTIYSRIRVLRRKLHDRARRLASWLVLPGSLPGWAVATTATSAVIVAVVVPRDADPSVPAPVAIAQAAAPSSAASGPAHHPLRDVPSPTPPAVGPPPPAPPAPPVRQTSARERPAPAQRDTIAEQSRLLLEADREARHGDPHRALELVGRHRARFPAGPLWDLREAVRVQALHAAGRTSEACNAAAKARKRGTSESIRQRIDRICPTASQTPARPDITGP